MIKNILYAADLGAFTRYALTHVESLAGQYNAKVSVIHVVPPIEVFTSAVLSSHCSEKVKKELLSLHGVDAINDMIRDQIFGLLSMESNGETQILNYIDNIRVLTGRPANVILDEARTVCADLIVIGNHSASTVEPHLLGSVATKILQLAKTPVYMIPMMKPSLRANLASSMSFS